jgi:hypothetical protein
MRRYVLPPLVGLMASMVSAFGGTITGNELLVWCDDKTNFSHVGACLGYIEDVVDQLIEAHIVCVPSQVTVGQIPDMVVKYLEAKPELRHLPGPSLIYQAIQPIFPCPN